MEALQANKKFKSNVKNVGKNLLDRRWGNFHVVKINEALAKWFPTGF